MAGYNRGSNLAAYQSAAAHGGVAASDPHRLIMMLMDGALDRIAGSRGCIQRRDPIEKARLVNRAVLIIGELRSSLDVNKGGEIAANLNDLYEYMTNKLLQASLRDSVEDLDEVSALLRQVRDAWAQVPAKMGSAPR